MAEIQTRKEQTRPIRMSWSSQGQAVGGPRLCGRPVEPGAQESDMRMEGRWQPGCASHQGGGQQLSSHVGEL